MNGAIFLRHRKPAVAVICSIGILCTVLFCTAACAQGLSDLKRPIAGVNAHLSRTAALDNEFDTRETAMRAIKDMGLGYMRLDIPWKRIQPSPDVWKWDELDAVVRLAKTNNVPILGVILAAPDWSSPPYNHISSWERFLDILVSRYGDTIKAWEIWNELNVEHFWPGYSLRGYVDMLKSSYRIIKGRYPDSVIVLAGMANNFKADDTWRELFSDGALDYCDAVGFHPYKLTGQEVVPVYSNIRSMMTRNGGREKPIWITEYGWTAAPAGTSVAQKDMRKVTDYQGQASRIMKTYLAHAAAGGGPFFIYELRDDKSGKFSGILENNFSRKPAANAIGWMVERLGFDFAFKEKQTMGDGEYLDIRSSGGRRYIVTWGKEAYTKVKRMMSTGSGLLPEVYLNLPADTVLDKLAKGDRVLYDQVVFWREK